MAPVEDFKGLVDGTGYKKSMDDETKPRMSLVPAALLRGVARVLMHGAKKYAAHNWRKGMAWSEPTSAALRHITAFNEGEDLDPESGLSHLWHAACNLAFLVEYEANPHLYRQFDDRFKRPEGPF